MSHKEREARTWRRGKVQELMVQVLNQNEISTVLKISQPTVSNDIAWLREEARKNLENHLQNVLPGEYENCMAGINQVLKMSWEIANNGKDTSTSNSGSNSNRTMSSTVDDRTRLQALALANDCYKYKMDLVTNGVVITDAIKFVQQKKEELSKVSDEQTEFGKDIKKNKIF